MFQNLHVIVVVGADVVDCTFRCILKQTSGLGASSALWRFALVLHQLLLLGEGGYFWPTSWTWRRKHEKLGNFGGLEFLKETKIVPAPRQEQSKVLASPVSWILQEVWKLH